MVKFYDVPAVMQVIGGVYLNPALLGYSDKYYFNENDFAGEEFHKILFGTIYNLFNLGVEKIKISTIENFLEQRPKAYAVYKLNRGAEYLKKLEENTQLEAFDYYYNRVKKMTLLRGYSSLGLDLTWLYDEDNIFDPKKKQAQEDFLDNSTLEEISNLINDKIDRIKVSCIKDVSNDMNQAGKGALALIKKYEETPDIGYPLFGHYVNAVHRGARLKKFYLRSAATGVGKAIVNDTIIPTPQGRKKVGKIKKGDYLFGADGKPTKVLAVYPQKRKKQIWRITFKDGRTVDCCKDHLWSFYEDKKHFKLITTSTEEIYKKGEKNNYKKNNSYCFRVPLPKPFNLPEEKNVFSSIPFSMGLYYDYFEENEKIPDEIINGTVQQRKNFLIGLFYFKIKINKKGLLEYHSKNKNLIDKISIILREFGYLVYLKKEKEEYYLYIDCPKEEAMKLIIRDNFDKEEFNKINSDKVLDNPIVKITPIKKYCKMTCFTVDNADCLFIINDGCVTHNTRAMIADACYVGSDKIFDLEKNMWVSNGTKEPVLFIATEQDTSEIQTMMLAFLSGVDEEHILTNSYLEGEKERTIQAAKLLENSNIYIKELPDFSLQDIEDTIKHAIRVKKVKYVFFDYLHTSVKILSEIGVKSGVKNLREDNILFLISVKLKDLCNKYGVFILTSTQLNSDYQVSDHPDQNLLRGAKAIADKIDFGSIMLQVTKEDEEKIKPIVDQLGFQMPSIKISIYKNRGNKYRGIYLWCNADKSICRIDPIFVTDWNMSLIEIEDLDIQVK